MIPTANKNPSAGTPDPNVSMSSGTSSQPNKWQGVTAVADHTPVTKKSNVGINAHPMDDNIDHLTSAERDDDSNRKKFSPRIHAANKEGKSSPPIVYDLGKVSSVPPRPSHPTPKNQISADDTFEDNVPVHLYGDDHFSISKHEDGALVDIEGGGSTHDGEVTTVIFPDAESTLPKKGNSPSIGDKLSPKGNKTIFDDTSTRSNRKDHHPSPIYDLGASSSTKLSKRISKRAHGLFARIPANSQDKKKTATNNRQINFSHSLSYSGKGDKGKNIVNNREVGEKVYASKMSVESQKLKIQKSEEAIKFHTNNGLLDRADEMMVVKLSDFDAMKMKLEELEVSQKEQRAEIEAQKQEIKTQKKEMEELKEAKKSEMEAQQQEMEAQKQEMEVQKREMEAQKQEMEAQKEEMEAQKEEIEEMKESQRAEMEVQKLRIQELEASHEEVRALVPVEIPHGADNSSPIHEMSSTLPSAHGQTFLRRRISSTFRNYHILSNSNGDDENGTALERDTFSLMMISKVWSRSWALGMVAFLFQIVLGAMITFDQNSLSADSSLFDVPFKVKSVVRVGQFLTIILCLSTQSDILTSVQSVLLLGGDSNWDVVIGERGHKSTSLWIIRILIPNLMKSTQGLLVTFASFVIIVQSDDIIDLLKDFTALMVLSETDNILFDLAGYGYLGKELMDQVAKVSDIKVPKEPTVAADTNPTSSSPSTTRCRKINFPFYIRYSVFLCLFGLMLGGWIMIVLNQMSGTYFYEKYPNCTFTYQGQDAFELAKGHFGDDKCWGGPLNSLECAFEGGDCIDFNIAYPLCKGRDDLTNVQSSVGNGICEEVFMILECDFDGGDCCPYSIFNSPFLGDNQCHGGVFNTAQCGFDNGDCNIFNAAYPQCPHAELGDIKGAQDFVLGDDVCDGGIYSSVECGWENGDCDVGQVGQDFIADFSGYFFFEIILVGRKRTMGILSDGIASVYHYNRIDKRWNPLGNLPTRGGEATFTFAMTMNHVGEDRIAISYFPLEQGEINWSVTGQVKVFDYVASNQTWAQVGQDIDGEEVISSFGYWIDMTSDGSRLLISAPNYGDYYAGGIFIYELNMAETLWDHVGNIIEGKAEMDQIGFYPVHISSDGSTVIFSSGRTDEDVMTRIYRYDQDSQDWMQLGSDIPSPFTFSPAISSDGTRIAVPSNAINEDAPGEVRVYDYDEMENSWVQVGTTITQSSDGDGFGFHIDMSGDGNILAISSAGTVGSYYRATSGNVQIYVFDSDHNEFILPYPRPNQNGNVIVDRDRDRDNTQFGLWLSMSGDGMTLSILGFNFIDKQVFARVYDLDQLFFIRCLVNNPDGLGDGVCSDEYPYNSAECGFDGGDCAYPSPVEGYPGCMVSHPEDIGDGRCNLSNLPMYNTTECRYDGGDCLPVDGYLGCLVVYPGRIGNGYCDSSYNTTGCGYDGGDCLPKPVEGYPGCLVPDTFRIGNGYCDFWRDPSYNTTECGYDGGDCLPKPVDGYPGCLVVYPERIGNNNCSSDPSYNTTECGYDGGDCLPKPVDGYPGCLVVYPERIGNNYCSSDPSYNTTECGYDGGDCLP